MYELLSMSGVDDDDPSARVPHKDAAQSANLLQDTINKFDAFLNDCSGTCSISYHRRQLLQDHRDKGLDKTQHRAKNVDREAKDIQTFQEHTAARKIEQAITQYPKQIILRSIDGQLSHCTPVTDNSTRCLTTVGYEQVSKSWETANAMHNATTQEVTNTIKSLQAKLKLTLESKRRL